MNFLPQYINGGPDLSYWSFLGELKIPIDDHEADERLHKSAAKSVSASTTIDCLNRQPIIIVRQTMHNCIFKHLYWKGMFRQKVSVVFHSFSWFKKEIDTSFHELSVRANRLTDNRRYGKTTGYLFLQTAQQTSLPVYFTNQALLQNAYGVQVGKPSN